MKRVNSSIKFNALMNTVLMASNMLVSLVTIPYVTRVLSVEGYGDVTFAQSISTWLTALCMVGVGTYGIRECARVRDDPAKLATLVRELLLVVTTSTVVVLSAFAACIVFVPRLSSLAPLMWMFLVSTLLMSYGVEWFYQGVEEYRYITVRSVVFKVLALALTVLLVRAPGDYLSYGAILALVACGNNVLNILRLRREVDFRLASRPDLRRHLGPVASFGALSIASAVYLSLDTFVLGMVSPDSYQVGLYQLSVKLKNVLFQILNAVLAVFIPRLSYYATHSEGEAFRSLLRKGSAITLDVCVLVAGYLLVFADGVVVLVSGPSFAQAAGPVRVMGAVNMLSCLSYLIGMCVLTPLGRERELSAGNLIGVPVSLALNLALDARLGGMGAAVSMLVAELFVFCAQLWFARDMLAELFPTRNVVKVAAANVAAVCASLALLGPVSAAWGLLAPVAGLIFYFLLLFVVLLLLREEGALISINVLINAVRNKKHSSRMQ